MVTGVVARLLAELVEFSHDAKDAAALTGFTLERLRTVVRWDGAIFACLPCRVGHAVVRRSRRLDGIDLESAFRHYVENLARMRREVNRVRAAERAGARALLDTDLFGERERERLFFYREIGRPIRLVNMLIAPITFRGRPIARMLLTRNGASRPFVARDVERVQPLLPAIGVAHAALAACRRTRNDVALTARERQIADLVAAGYRNEDIATVLGTSRNTVRNQLAMLFDKLGVTNRAELASVLARSR
jgi:DNA-binding CsgD family transcriptional regulator